MMHCIPSHTLTVHTYESTKASNARGGHKNKVRAQMNLPPDRLADVGHGWQAVAATGTFEAAIDMHFSSQPTVHLSLGDW
jgi:hypothetical protein